MSTQTSIPRWTLLLTLLLAFSLAIMTLLYARDQSDNGQMTESTNTQTNTANEELRVAHVQKVLGTYLTPQNFLRKYVLVEAGLSDDVVTDIASQLHQIEPDTWYYLMDSDAQFATMLEALPLTAEGDYSTWPKDYVETHFVARVMQEIRADDKGGASRVWMVEGGRARGHLYSDI